MVVKRQCSFCADEIEPGTGTMYVKRDGTVFHFCSSSCRKQQLHLGRLGQRRKWTRAHALRRAQEQSATTAAPTVTPPAAPSVRSEPKTGTAPKAPVKSPPKRAGPPAAKKPAPSAAESPSAKEPEPAEKEGARSKAPRKKAASAEKKTS